MNAPASIPTENTAAPTNSQIVNGMSVDVEEWFQVGAFEDTISHDDWARFAPRVERNVTRILELFAAANVKATFFTLGWVAERHPALIRQIVEQGHEIASHGYDHARVFTFDRAGFAADLERARKAIEDAAGQQVTGYRAPSFSIDQRTPWAFDVMAEQGYAYSSSVAPVVHDHYGWPDAPRFAFQPLAGSSLVEVPVTTAEFAGRRLAAGGGGFFRVLPYAFSTWAIRQVNGQARRPAIFYFHPWEIDPDQPRLASAPIKSKLRHYTNLGKMAGRLERLLGDFAWGRMDALAGAQLAHLERDAA